MNLKNCAADDVFKTHKIKCTRQRKWVFSYLQTCEYPVTAEAIYLDLKKQPTIDEAMNLSTVYRILDVFQKSHLVRKKVYGAENCSTYEILTHEHTHFLVCAKCHKMTTLKECPLQGYDESVRLETNYQILEHRLELLGICPECQKK